MELNIERDVCDLFLKSKLATLSPVGQRNQVLINEVRFYILYTQIFVYDAIHDFGIKSTEKYNREHFIKSWIYVYKKNIRSLINEFFGQTFLDDETNINEQKRFHNYIKDNFFNYTESENAVEEEQSDNFKITQIFYVSEKIKPWKLLNDQDILQEMMSSILNIFGMPVTPINQFKSLNYPLDTVIYYNGIKDSPTYEPKKIIIVTDSPGSAAKTQYIQSYFKSLQHYQLMDKCLNVLSIAHLYDSSPSDRIGVIDNFEIFNNFILNEYFTFHRFPGITIIPLIKYSIKNEARPKLTITNFLNTPCDNWNSTISIVENLKTLISQTNPKTDDLYIKTGLFKILGDKSKRDFLYGIKTKQIRIDKFDNFIEIFLANDILSAMIGAIDFEGSIISGSSIGIELASGVEFLGVRENNKLSEKNKIIIDRDLADPPIPGSEPGQTRTYVTARRTQRTGRTFYEDGENEVTSKYQRLNFGKAKFNKKLKSVENDIKFLLKLK